MSSASEEDDGRKRLLDEIRRLWVEAGSPSTRTVASRIPAPHKMSHTTVAQLLNRQRVPHWPSLAAIVQALGGDPKGTVFDLWKTFVNPPFAPAGPPRPKIRYCQVAVDVTNIADTCNEFGARGWELVRIIASDTVADLHHLVMRTRHRTMTQALAKSDSPTQKPVGKKGPQRTSATRKTR